MRFAIRTGVRETDPVTAAKSGFQQTDGIAAWSSDQIIKALATHPVNTPTGLALRLMFETAAALTDVVKLGPHNLKDGFIIYRRQKLGEKSAIDAVCPLSPELLSALAAIKTPTYLTFNGKPRSNAGLGGRIKAVAAAFCFKGSAHGIRKARAVMLYEAGWPLEAIAAVLGHADTKMTAHYIASASRVGIAKKAYALANLNDTSRLTEGKSDE